MTALSPKICAQLGQCGQEDRWWRVPGTRSLESLVLNRLAKVVGNHTTLLLDRTANHDISEFDIMLAAGCPSSDAEHQSDPDRLEAGEHVFSHAGGEGDIVPPSRKACDDDVVIANAVKGVDVVVVRGIGR